MDEANRTEVKNVLGAIFLGQKDHISQVKPLQVGDLQIREPTDDIHHIIPNDLPTSFEELRGEAIRTRSLVGWELMDSGFDLGLRDGRIKALMVSSIDVKRVPVESSGPRAILLHGCTKMILNDMSLLFMGSDPTIIMFEPKNDFFSPTGIRSDMKEACIDIALPEIIDPRTLLLPRLF